MIIYTGYPFNFLVLRYCISITTFVNRQITTPRTPRKDEILYLFNAFRCDISHVNTLELLGFVVHVFAFRSQSTSRPQSFHARRLLSFLCGI